MQFFPSCEDENYKNHTRYGRKTIVPSQQTTITNSEAHLSWWAGKWELTKSRSLVVQAVFKFQCRVRGTMVVLVECTVLFLGLEQ